MKGEVGVFGISIDLLADGRGGTGGLAESVEQQKQVDQAQHVCSNCETISCVVGFRDK